MIKSNKEEILLNYLKKNNVKWNSRNELKYNNQVIKNSNIFQLVNHAVNKYNNDNILGMKSFYKLLATLKIPDFIVLNKKGKLIMKNVIERKNDKKWKPPGRK